MTQSDTQSEYSSSNSGLNNDRQILQEAHAKGSVATLFSFFRLSGPGWLQSAITLGGGSLVSSLFLGVVGGVSLLWVQVIAMLFGVVMLSAISYVTLSSRLRPFDAINKHINPVLGYGWLLATILANVIWCMPQFSLCFDAIDSGFFAGSLDQKVKVAAVDPAESSKEKEKTSEKEQTSDSAPNAKANESSGVEAGEKTDPKKDEDPKQEPKTDKNSAEKPIFAEDGSLNLRLLGEEKKVANWAPKFGISFVILIFATTMVIMSSKGGSAAKWFDMILKGIIGIIVLCFVGVVVVLSMQGSLNWSEIGAGLIPNLSLWSQPSDTLAALIEKLPESGRGYWTKTVVSSQQGVMISTFATAVGINMTFLLPYSLLARGWDKPFRGLARFDLIFGMLLPFLIVTSCVVISAASAFHGKSDGFFLNNDPNEVVKSPIFGDASKILAKRLKEEKNLEQFELVSSNKQEMAKWVTTLSLEEKVIASNLVKRNSKVMAEAMAPLFSSSADASDGAKTGSIVFAIGAMAMGFSTIIILMLINGYAIAELTGSKVNSLAFLIGILVAGIAGFSWPLIWQGESKLWLVIVASRFGFLLLPIAYGSFFLLMNSKVVLGDQRPVGASRWIWNILLAIAFSGTVLAVGATLVSKLSTDQGNHLSFILGAGACFIALTIIGFFAVSKSNRQHIDSGQQQ